MLDRRINVWYLFIIMKKSLIVLITIAALIIPLRVSFAGPMRGPITGRRTQMRGPVGRGRVQMRRPVRGRRTQMREPVWRSNIYSYSNERLAYTGIRRNYEIVSRDYYTQYVRRAYDERQRWADGLNRSRVQNNIYR